MATKAEIAEELAALKVTHEEFRQKVWDTAMKFADENDLCGEVERALAEMGLHPPQRQVQVIIDIPDLEKFYRPHHFVVQRHDDENVDDVRDLIRERLSLGDSGEIHVAVQQVPK